MHYVYYLRCPVTDQLLYIGRSRTPKLRLYNFKRDKGIEAVLGMRQRFSNITEACLAEIQAIKDHRPPYNKILVSSVGGLGYTHKAKSKAAIGKANSGLQRTEAARQKMSEAARGRPGYWKGKRLRADHVAKIVMRHTGRINSPETLERMRQAALKRWSSTP